MPRVSVIIPCYNSEAFILKAVESVVRQSYSDWELIVVNDGSTDRCEEILKEAQVRYSNLRVLSQPNKGVCCARNAGFKQAADESEYVLFLDADDWLEPAMLEVLIRYMDDKPSVGIARCEYRFIDERDQWISSDENKQRFVARSGWVATLDSKSPETPFVSILTLCGMIPSICLIRKRAFTQAGGFDENFGHHHEDADLFMRISLDWKVHYVFGQALVRRRRHPSQNTHKNLEFRKKAALQEKKLHDKWLGLCSSLPQAQRDEVLSAWDFKVGPFEAFLTLRRAHRAWNQKRPFYSIYLALAAMRIYGVSLLKRFGVRRP